MGGVRGRTGRGERDVILVQFKTYLENQMKWGARKQQGFTKAWLFSQIY